MLNKEKHQVIMGRILKDIYSDIILAPLLGFKGGTCAYFFYGLPRFSVDLDFDLLRPEKEDKEMIFEKIVKILGKHGQIKDQRIKRFTIFALLSYGGDDHNIKVEINTREIAPNIQSHYELKEHLGISMMAAKKDYLFSGKLVALVSRGELAMRDVYDINFFTKNNWDINAEIIKLSTGKNIPEHLADCVAVIEKIKDNELLQGIGELLGEKEKAWVKKDLKSETIFLLKNYMSAMKAD